MMIRERCEGKSWSENQKGRDYLGILDRNGMIILI
jgi:hypothetical protein